MTVDDVYEELRQLRTALEQRLEEPADAPAPPPRRRLTKDDVLAAHLAALTKASPEHHSVTLKSNAKGETQVEVTVRTDASVGLETPAQAFAEASRLYVQARQVFEAAGFPVSGSKGAEDGGQA